MKEQARSKGARIRGEKHIRERKWPTIRSAAKFSSAIKTADQRMAQINNKKDVLIKEQSQLYQTELIEASFKLKGTSHHKPLLIIEDGSVSYPKGPSILHNLNVHFGAKARIALCGDNGSGKSTLLKAILNEPYLNKTGHWLTPHRKDVGYLDQHYQHMNKDKTVLELMIMAMPTLPYACVRNHLNTFLFRNNEEVHTLVKNLSAGEKARLSLALIAANPPSILLLDELTNNLDLETRGHVIKVLTAFPGGIIAISHDEDFLKAIPIEISYQIKQGTLIEATQHKVNNDE